MKNLCQHTDCIQGSASHGRLIAAGPLTKQPGTVPYRIVLLAHGTGFAVYSETFPGDMSFEHGVPDVETHLMQGNYFIDEELVRATECFCDRLHRNANFYHSLYRKEE